MIGPLAGAFQSELKLTRKCSLRSQHVCRKTGLTVKGMNELSPNETTVQERYF
jgi:hypothetical protein